MVYNILRLLAIETLLTAFLQNSIKSCFFLILYPHWPCQFHLCLQIQQVSEGNPIPERFLLTVTDAICSDIISFPTGKTQQVRLEKFRLAHCLIHDRDELACRHEVEQLAVWFSGNNQEQYAAKKAVKL